MAGEAKFWVGIAYPENMIPDWEDKIAFELEMPLAYCVHFMDRDTKSEHRKDHVHIMMAWPNTTTEKTARKLINRLSLPGKVCCPLTKAVHNVRNMYDYLIHDTEDCRKKGKELYPVEARITCNGFDIGLYEQISLEDKAEALREICDMIVRSSICNFADAYVIVTMSEEFKEPKYWEAFRAYASVIDRLCKGVFLKTNARREESSGNN